MNKKIAIVQCIDDNFCGNMMCITSCVQMKTVLTDIPIYIICLSTNPFISYYKQLGIYLIYADKYYNDTVKQLDSHQWCKFVYMRFSIFKLDIFKQYDMVCYIDVDTFMTSNMTTSDFIIIYNNIDSLGMIPEYDLAYKINTSYIKQACLKNNIEYIQPDYYYNAGVMFIKRNILTDDTYNKLMYLSKYSKDFKSNDQDIINLAFAKQITPIDVSYNLYNDTYISSSMHINNIQPNDTNVKIWHYAGIPAFEQKFMCQMNRFYSMSLQFGKIFNYVNK